MHPKCVWSQKDFQPKFFLTTFFVPKISSDPKSLKSFSKLNTYDLSLALFILCNFALVVLFCWAKAKAEPYIPVRNTNTNIFE